jgi:hypothetical protein
LGIAASVTASAVEARSVARLVKMRRKPAIATARRLADCQAIGGATFLVPC